MVLIRSIRPRKGDEVHNLTILWYIHRYREFYIGTYYFPNINDILPVLDIPREIEYPRKFFETIDLDSLRNAYRLICIPFCGACCEKNAGAFMFREEAIELGFSEILDRLPYKDIELLNNIKTRIYYLSIKEKGRCIFYDEKSRNCRIHNYKPVICLISFCSFAIEKNGVIYYKVGVHRDRPIYREWSGSLKELAKYIRKAILL